MMKNNKTDKTVPTHSKHNNAKASEAEHTITDTEFGQEAAHTASASHAASETGKNKGVVQKVQESEQ